MASHPALDIDLLRSFALIAESGSFTRAAERVGRSQSAVSLQVQRLESLVGHRLFVRGKGAVVQLTPAGQDLLGPARELLLLNDATVALLRAGSPPPAAGPGEAGPMALERPFATGRLRDRPSIAVLPFMNSSGDQQQDHVAAGFVDNIVLALSRIRWLSVTMRGTRSAPENRAVDTRLLEQELGVRYVLQGGVHSAGNRLRVTARLLDAETGRHLWADKFDGGLDDVFDLQDRIADRVAGIVEPSLRRAEIERSRRKRPGHLDAYDCYLRALPLAAAQMPDEAGRAIPLLDRALKLDPDYAAAHALISWCHELCFARGGFVEAHKSAARRHASTVLASDTDDGTALAVAGFVMTLLTADHHAALAAIDRGLALNPSSATVLYLGAQAHALAGVSDKAMSFADRALWLNPFDPLAFQAHMALGEAAVLDDRHDDAASCFARAAQAKPNFSSAYIFQGIASALAGQTAQGRHIARCGLALEPGFCTRLFFEHGLAQPLREKLADGSRLLGLAA